MKVKIDFVSNSSSTSFVAWGLDITDNESIDIDKLEERLFTKRKDTHLTICKTSYIKIIGFPPTLMEDTETLLQFKQRICNELDILCIDATPNDIKFFFEEDYDG